MVSFDVKKIIADPINGMAARSGNCLSGGHAGAFRGRAWLNFPSDPTKLEATTSTYLSINHIKSISRKDYKGLQRINAKGSKGCIAKPGSTARLRAKSLGVAQRGLGSAIVSGVSQELGGGEMRWAATFCKAASTNGMEILDDGWPESVEEHSERCKYEDLIA